MDVDPREVAVWRGEPAYPNQPPFHPSESYPELDHIAPVSAGPFNGTYAAVRGALETLGCDAEHAGSPNWNPLGAWVRPGDRVLVKPNWVMHDHPDEALLGPRAAYESLVTHTAVLRAVIDYVQLALRGEGRIVLADAPLQGCDFDALLERSCIAELQEHYARLAGSAHDGRFLAVPIEVKDLRLETSRPRRGIGLPGMVLDKSLRAEDAHSTVQLGSHSSLEPISSDYRAFRVTCYDASMMQRAHRPGHHAYCISNEVLLADAVINVPKLKAHKKGGVTVALKNLVGINGHKSYLPHHRQGSVADSGDEYLSQDRLKLLVSQLQDAAYRSSAPAWRRRLATLGMASLSAAGRLVREEGTETGCWYGNDTIWRTCLDLNRILLYADVDGQFTGIEPDALPTRRVFHIVDGICGGEADGPLTPTPRYCGLVIAGPAAPYVDLAATLLMGFDWRSIPIVREAFGSFDGALLTRTKPEELRLRSNERAWDGTPLDGSRRSLPENLAFVPPPGWESVVNRDESTPPRVPLLAAVRRPGALWRYAARRAASR